MSEPSAASISVIVPTFGGNEWIEQAQRAVESANSQSLAPHEIIHVHADTLASARNQGAEQAEGRWLLFLDADDELDKFYVEAMDRAVRSLPVGTKRLFQPATLGVHPDGHEDPEPVVIPERDIFTGNYLVIGTLVERDMFLRVGGFEEWPLYEDWCLMIRCFQDGAISVPVPDAVYRVHVNANGRNLPDRATQVRVYNQIRTKRGLR